MKRENDVCHALLALFNTSSDAIYVKDHEGRTIFVNESLARMNGMQPKDMIGKFSREIFPLEAAERIDRDDREIMESGTSKTYIETIILTTGEKTYETTKTAHRDASGKVIGLLGVSKEITKRQQTEKLLKTSEERFRRLFEEAPMSIQISTPDGRTAAVNAAWIRLWGANEAFVDFALTKYNMLSDPELKKSGMLPYVERAFQGEEIIVPPLRYDPASVGMKGRVRWVEGFFYPLRDTQGKLREVILMHNDITDRKLSEEALAESEAKEKAARLEAERALEMRDKFLSVASHELKTPLTSLSMQIQLIQRLAESGKIATLSQEKTSELARHARNQLSRFSRLVEDLLDVSKIAAGKLELELKWVDVPALVRDLVERCRIEIEETGCTFDLEIPGPIQALIDPDKIEQVLINLISNAGKYAAGKPIHLSVSEDEEWIRIVVRDEGPGISTEDQARIFGRFERAVSTRHYGGLGLGLYITRQIVDAHHGKIRVESTPGHGAAFIVELQRTGERTKKAVQI